MSFSGGGKIIFDMDGVITSEERYWDAAALTVWELFFGGRYLRLKPLPGLPDFKVGPCAAEIASVRRIIFCEDMVIRFFKENAVNSNWDLAFLTFSYQFLLYNKYSEEDAGAAWKPSFEAILEAPPGFFKSFSANNAVPIAGLATDKNLSISSLPWPGTEAGSCMAPPVWDDVRDIFQEWYYGEELFKKRYAKEPGTSGKTSLLEREAPLIPVSGIRAALQELLRQGWRLGIATGRPQNEIDPLLHGMDIRKYFQNDSIVTYNEVVRAENSLKDISPSLSLGKPHPYSFLKAYWGEEKGDRELVSGVSPTPPRGMCLVVGDSMADLLAARQAGASFIGVLTGIAGETNRKLFQEEKATAVLPDMTHIPSFLIRNHF